MAYVAHDRNGKEKNQWRGPEPGVPALGQWAAKARGARKGWPCPLLPGTEGRPEERARRVHTGSCQGRSGSHTPHLARAVAFGKPRPRSPGRLVVKGAARSALHGAAGGRRRVHREQPRRPEPPAASGPERVRHARALSPHGGRPGGGRGSVTPLRGTSLRPREAAVRQVTLLATEPGPVESHTIL